MKKFLTSSVWLGLLHPKKSSKILQELEREVIEGHLLYTSMASLSHVTQDFPIPGKENTFFYLVQEIVEEVFPLTKEMLPLFFSQNLLGISKADSIEILSAHFHGIPQILYADTKDWNTKGWENWQLSLANLLGKAD